MSKAVPQTVYESNNKILNSVRVTATNVRHSDITKVKLGRQTITERTLTSSVSLHTPWFFAYFIEDGIVMRPTSQLCIAASVAKANQTTLQLT